MRNATAQAQPQAVSFSARLDKYKKWRDDLASAISDYQVCRKKLGFVDGQDELHVFELIEQLKSDKLVVALVAEFSRGKTELLNALFFADHKQRLLPSTAGRTTMCPTEISYNDKENASIKLLPIETRKSALTIAEYKRTLIHWTTIHILKPNSTEELREVFSQVTKTKKVNKREAEELGLHNLDNADSASAASENDLVEIPVWRHAIINYPHPLLKQGLVILDTPGLNALGAEPELTLSMLPDAHAVLFVLAADIGVTKTDLEIWRDHVNSADRIKSDGLLVVLNKIDSLWDETRDAATIASTLTRQIDETARTLKIERSMVFPVSSKAGLIAVAKDDPALLEKSGIPILEQQLAEHILPARHEFIRRKIVYEVNGLIEGSRNILNSKLAETDKQLARLRALSGRNLDSIHKIVTEVRAEKLKYDKELEGFQLTRTKLHEQATSLLVRLGTANLDNLIVKTRRDMHESWTTRGLKKSMETFFRGAVGAMNTVNKQADDIRDTVDTMYQKLHTEYGLAQIRPARLSLVPYLLALKKIETKCEEYRNSATTMMTEQHFVINKFFITLVSAARAIFAAATTSVRNWFQEIVSSVFLQIKEHKIAIDQNLESLKKIHGDLDNLNIRIAELERVKAELAGQMKTIDGLLDRIHQPI